MWLSGKPQVVGCLTSEQPEIGAEMGTAPATRLTDALRVPHGALAGYLPDNHRSERKRCHASLIRLGSEMRVAGGDRGLTPLDAAESHLRACELCWLATHGPHGLTCCTLYYALPEPWCLLVMSSERPRHVANLKTDSACSVCVPRLPSSFGEPARQLTARCDGFPVVDPLRVDAEAELFYARYPPARDFVDQVRRTRVEAELVPIRLRLREGEYLDDERYGVESVAVIDAFPPSADGS